MKKRLCLIILIVLLLSNWTVSVAHTAELEIEKTLTQADGLVSNRVLTVFEDRHGTMWFGTTDGLTRYDGENFRTFTTEDGLARNTIGLIFEDQQGMLWFADGVLSHFLERGKSMDMSWMETPLSELDLDIQPYHVPTEETRRIVPLKGVSRYDGQAFKIFTTADGLAHDTIKDIFEDKAGTLWFATSSGVSQYDGEKFNNIIVNGPMGMNVLPDWWNQITAIAQDTVGNFWFGSTAGITYYNVQKSHFRYFAVDADFVPFQEMGQSPNGKTWIQQAPRYFHEMIKGIFFLNETDGWVVGWPGIVFHTQDGGLTWKRQNSNSYNELYAAYFIDRHIGWVVGQFGEILHTVDGGKRGNSSGVGRRQT